MPLAWAWSSSSSRWAHQACILVQSHGVRKVTSGVGVVAASAGQWPSWIAAWSAAFTHVALGPLMACAGCVGP